MWTCPRCGTHVEPPFTVCRNCGTAADDAPAMTAVQPAPDRRADEPPSTAVMAAETAVPAAPAESGPSRPLVEPAGTVPSPWPGPATERYPQPGPRSLLETILIRAGQGALAGAAWGSLYGATFALMMWFILTNLTPTTAATWMSEFPYFLIKCVLSGAFITALVGALLRQFPTRKRTNEPPPLPPVILPPVPPRE